MASNTNDNWKGMNWIRKASRLAIYLRDGMVCFYCGRGILEGAKLTLDHIIARSRKINNKPDNLITCCDECNRKRGNAYIEDWLIQVSEETGTPLYLISASLSEQLRKDVREYRAVAKELLEARPTWHKALKYAAKLVEELS